MSRILVVSDQTGRKLGYFIPAEEVDPALYHWARDEFTDEEIQRARQEPGGLTISELLADLNEG